MEPRAVLFDFGGVLLRQDWREYDVFGQRHGLPPGVLRRALYQTEAWRALQVGRGDRDRWRSEALAVLAEHIGDRAEAVFDAWRSRPLDFHHPNLQLVRSLRSAGVRVGLLSNAAADLIDVYSPYVDFSAFDDLVVSALVGLAKPDEAIFRLAADRIGVSPEQCFFIDDLEPNVVAATNVGMAGHHFRGDYAALHADLRAAGIRWDGAAGVRPR